MATFSNGPDEFLVYDWRAPISSVYYDGGLGKTTYATPDGEREVDVALKRQFMVDDGKILTVFDTDETVGDQMLLEVLDESSDVKMKSIVTTIQKNKTRLSAIRSLICCSFKGQPVPEKRQPCCSAWLICSIVIAAI